MGFGAAGRATAVLAFMAAFITTLFMALGLLLLLLELEPSDPTFLPEGPFLLGLVFVLDELERREGLFIGIFFGAGLRSRTVFFRLRGRPGRFLDLVLGLGPSLTAAAGLFKVGSFFIGFSLPPDAGRFLGDMATKLWVQPQ